MSTPMARLYGGITMANLFPQCRGGPKDPKTPVGSNPTLQIKAAAITLSALKKTNPTPAEAAPAADCAETATCPLSTVAAGTTVCIKQLAVQPDVLNRLREMGLGEEQRVRLVSRHPSLICQVCNARVALSQKLAEAILVEPVGRPA